MAGAAIETGGRIGGDPVRNQGKSLVGQMRTLKTSEQIALPGGRNIKNQNIEG